MSKTGHNIARFTIIFAVATIVLVPIAALPFLVHYRLWIWVWAVVIYGLPVFVVICTSFRPLYHRLKTSVNKGGQSAASPDAAAAEWYSRFAGAQPSIDELLKTRQLLISSAVTALDLVWFIFVAPIFAVHMSLGIHNRIRWLWRLPFDLYTVWYFGLAAMAYSLTAAASPLEGVGVGIMGTAFTVRDVFRHFSGRTRPLILSVAPHKIQASDVLRNAVLVSVFFGSIHYGLSTLDSTAYSQRLNWFDAVYLSVVTLATVGYGDISPRSVAAKLACMAEIMSGIAVLVMSSTILISLWLKNNQPQSRADGGGAGADDVASDHSAT